MDARAQSDVAVKMGWTPLGKIETTYQTRLSEPERLDLGLEMATKLIEIGKRAEELADYSKGVRDGIKQVEDEIEDMAQTIKGGCRVETAALSCFLDRGERVYLDDCGNEVKREQARPEDKQIRMAG